MTTYNVYIFDVVLYVYLGAFFFHLLYLITKRELGGKIGFGLVLGGAVLHFAGMIIRWIESHALGYGYIPLSNMYESLVFFSWTIALFYILIDRKYKQRVFGVIASPLAAFFLALTSLIPGIKKEIKPLIPALQSNWLAIHVITCFLGYAAFALAFGISVAYLIQAKREREGKGMDWLPSSAMLDDINYKTILLGFPFLTIGIITGAAWAHYAWGSYWSWDPKETWSLITWFIYAAFLHARYTREWKGKKTALLSIIGFIAVIFTYFGVNYLISGLHSYV